MVTHLLARPQGFLLFFKHFRSEAQQISPGIGFSAILNTYRGLRGLDSEPHFFPMEDIKFIFPNKGQVFITFLFGLPFVFQYIFNLFL